MKKTFLILFLGLLAIFFMGTVVKMVSPEWIAPNLIAVLLVYLAFYEVNVFGAVLSFLLGLELDLGSGLLLGPWAAACVLVYVILAFSSCRVFIESHLVVAFATFLGSILAAIIYQVIIFAVNDEVSYAFDTWFKAGFESLQAALVAPLIFKLLCRKRVHQHDTLVFSDKCKTVIN